MIKKISAIFLALVLCLTVVVMPVSAYELSSDSKIAYVVELDKENYSAGETVTVKLFIYADEATQYNGGAIVFGCSSDVFDMSENNAADIKASATTGDIAGTFYKQLNEMTWAWQTNTTVFNNIVTNNTEEENKLFDQYVKVAPARLSTADGTHENSQNSKMGYYGSDFNTESENGTPFLTFQLKLRDDLADGTVINVGVPTGPMAKNYTYFDTFKSPGTAVTKVKTTAANSEVVWSTDSQIGAAITYEESIVTFWKDQIRMDKDDNSEFSIRHLAYIEKADWENTFGTDEDNDVAGTKNIQELGFIYYAGAKFEKDAAAKWLQSGATDETFTKVPVNYVSTGMKGHEGDYVFSVVVTGIEDKNAMLSSLAYVIWTDDAGVKHYSYFDDVVTETFTDLYDRYVEAH